MLACACNTGQARRTPETVAAAAARQASRSVLIETEELRRSPAKDAYEIIQFLRPSWLQQAGAYSFRNDGGIAVYLNSVRLANVEALREVESGIVTSIRYFDSMAAQFRFGLSHNHGAIQVITERPK
jgi:hypothetical protein